MIRSFYKRLLCVVICGLLSFSVILGQSYPWMPPDSQNQTITIADIEPPADFERVKGSVEDYGEWLRHLLLKAPGTPVRLFDGRLKTNQKVHFRVINIDVGENDLQQCADAVMRLRAEYLFANRKFEDIHFNFTSGDISRFDHWAAGYRPEINGSTVVWKKTATPDPGYGSFRDYLNNVFTYAGSYSLAREMVPVADMEDIEIGDVFIQGGFPGHAVLVVDLAVHSISGRKVVLLAQSYMPAQDIHILINPGDTLISPWYPVSSADSLYTPEWTFAITHLRRFKQE